MIIVFAIDALEYKKVEEFNCKNLKQEYYGKTDISEFYEPKTMVLWSSFVTGVNKESEVLDEGKKEMWNKKWNINETFFSAFKNPLVIDLPGFSYDLPVHELSRNLLKKFLEENKEKEKGKIKKQYNNLAFEHHRKIKKKFFDSVNRGHDFILGYFSIIDVIGHLNFGNRFLIKMLYNEVDEIASKLREMRNKLIILSDHGMKAMGYFGDHSDYGFWSTNFPVKLDKPKITDFYELILNEAKK